MKERKDVLKDIFGPMFEAMLQGEINNHLDYKSNDHGIKTTDNRRNGYTNKKVKTSAGEVDIKVPRDRDSSFEPQPIPKRQKDVSEIEEKVLAMHAKGMSQRDISEQIKNLYDVEIFPELVSKISEKIMPDVTAWQNRPLEAVYPFVFMDAIHYKVKENHQYITKAAYVVLGINLDGQKDILGIWIGENESSKFWLNVLNELKTREIKDVFLFCVDGLTGFRQAIETAFPNAQIQRCIIHQIRSSTRFVSYKHIKELMSDLKKVYQAISEEEAMNNLILFKDKWGKTYPSCVKSWEENWDILSTFFAYPPEVWKIIYTTNIIEGLNRQFRQITKNKPSFTNDDSLRKMLYLASQKIVERWTQRCRNWDIILSQLSIIFEDRIPA